MVLFRVPGLISLAFAQDPAPAVAATRAGQRGGGDVSSRPDQAMSRLDRSWHVSAACSHGRQGSQRICTTTHDRDRDQHVADAVLQTPPGEPAACC
jgi:hypothetical protein